MHMRVEYINNRLGSTLFANTAQHFKCLKLTKQPHSYFILTSATLFKLHSLFSTKID
jgi:hypothetical protein